MSDTDDDCSPIQTVRTPSFSTSVLSMQKMMLIATKFAEISIHVLTTRTMMQMVT